MELNLLTGMLIVLLMVYMVYSRGKMLFDHKKALEDASYKGDFKKIFTGKVNIIVYIAALVVAVGGFVFVFFNQSAYDNYEAWLLVFAVITITSATDMIRTSILYTTYYNEKGIFHDTDFIRYSSIKNFKPKRIPITTDVYLFNGNMHTLPTKALQMLESKIVANKGYTTKR